MNIDNIIMLSVKMPVAEAVASLVQGIVNKLNDPTFDGKLSAAEQVILAAATQATLS